MANAKKAAKKAAKKTAAKKAATRRVMQGDTAQARAKQGDAETAMYEVLEPFKFRGVKVKPGAWLELTAAEAEPYQEAELLGTEEGDVPDADPNTDDDESGTQTAGGGANVAAGTGPSSETQ